MKTTNTLPETISISWHYRDIQEIRPDLSADECKRVLHALEVEHDPNEGINWDIIEIACDEVYPIH